MTREEIYTKHATELIRFATGLVGPTDAADIVADAVVKTIWSGTWDSVINPRAYLYRAVLNESRMQHRSTMRRQARERQTAPSEVYTVPEAGTDVWEAVGSLQFLERACVFLKYWEGMSAPEIADHLDISPRSVRRHLERSRSTLRRALK